MRDSEPQNVEIAQATSILVGFRVDDAPGKARLRPTTAAHFQDAVLVEIFFPEQAIVPGAEPTFSFVASDDALDYALRWCRSKRALEASAA